eukprot:06036.XXX_110213_110326_1 [CDS] Oithona nana genome sequencing.
MITRKLLQIQNMMTTAANILADLFCFSMLPFCPPLEE